MPVMANVVIPNCLMSLANERRWVIWRLELNKAGKLTKIPYQPTAPWLKASVIEPSTWATADVALAVHEAGKCNGIGLALMGLPLVAFDIDHCIDDAGNLHPWAQRFLTRCGATYVEMTPSGHGLRVLGNGSGPYIQTDFIIEGGPLKLEIYRCATRYITVTGNRFKDAPDCLGELDAVADEVLAELEAAKKQQKKKPTLTVVANNTQAPLPSLEQIIKHGHFELWSGDRSRAEWFVVNRLIREGKSDEEVAAVITDAGNGISAHCLDQNEDPDRYAMRVIQRARVEQAGKGAVDGSPTDLEIAKLAKLSATDYERQRKGAAEQIGFRAEALDRLVKAERDKAYRNADTSQGRSIALKEPQPWDTPVNGAELLDAMATAIRSHVVMSDHGKRTASLWALHSHLVHECFSISPRLAIVSPTKGCGKTTLLDVVGCLTLRPLSASNISAAATFRVIEQYHPCLLIDEGDSFLGASDELRGILNSGHRKGGAVLRVVGDDFEPRLFSTYGACAIALIGSLPPTLADRSVTIRLKRRRAGEPIAPLRLDRMGHLEVLARQCARWASDNYIAVGAADPSLPAELTNRLADNWRILKAIASVAGGPWPDYVDAAGRAEAMSGAADQELLVQLLRDIRDIPFPDGVIGSAKLVQTLIELEGRPWTEMGKQGDKNLTQNKLARMLSDLGIAPEPIGPASKRISGYRREPFKEPIERYFGAPQGGDRPPPHGLGDLQPHNLTQCDEIWTSCISQPHTSEPECEVGKCTETLSAIGLCEDVRLRNPQMAGGGPVVPSEAGNGSGWPGLNQAAVDHIGTEVLAWASQQDDTVTTDQLLMEIRQRLAECGVPDGGAMEVGTELVMRTLDAMQEVPETPHST
jgi:putative DNA primase/helicase